MTFNPEPYNIPAAIGHWLLTFGGFAAVVFCISFAASLVMFGAEGPGRLLGGIRGALRDLLRLSRRRIWAISQLTIREAVRRKALMVFVVFAILFMFAGWFLSDTNERADLQIKVYVSFVLTAITWLIVPVVLLVSCWGIPEDIKSRSLHTVVTKPTRKSEIILGRVLGFVSVATVLLLIMGAIGYVWVIRQTPSVLRTVDEQIRGQRVQGVDSGKQLEVLVSEGEGSPQRYEAGSLAELRTAHPKVYDLFREAQESKLRRTLVSRVPVYGALQFRDREGNEASAGVNTGDIWTFRSYIEGATKSRAIWAFQGIQRGREDEGLMLESRFEAFRTHKGRMGQSVLCRYVLVNDDSDLRVPLPSFEIAEFTQNTAEIPRKLTYYDERAKSMQTVDLFDDVVSDGTLTVEVQCLDYGQYIGMAQSDLFVRLPDRHFASGFFKSLFGIWLMLTLIIVLSVTASSFSKGPVATVLTFSIIVFGQWFRDFMREMVAGEFKGGGALESVYRIVTHMNPITPMPETVGTRIVQAIDAVFIKGLWLVEHLVPDFSYYRMSPYVANGFDVPWSAALLPSLAMTLAYLLPCLLIGYYSLTLRELESK